MAIQAHAHRQAFRPGRTLALAGAILAGLAPVVPPSGAAAQASNLPIVQVICLVSGGTAQTVRVIYPATVVKNLHVFTPVSGGSNVVIYPSGPAKQVYSLVVPAGRYTMKYATQTSYGGYPPVLSSYHPVIVIPPFKVVGQMCERSQVVGAPSS